MVLKISCYSTILSLFLHNLVMVLIKCIDYNTNCIGAMMQSNQLGTNTLRIEVRQHFFVEIGLEIISTAILSLPLTQVCSRTDKGGYLIIIYE